MSEKVIESVGQIPSPGLPPNETPFAAIVVEVVKGDKGDKGDKGEPGAGFTVPAVPAPNSVLQGVYPDGSGNPFFAPLTLDQILPAFTFSFSGGTNVELGSTVSTPAFTASYSAPPALVTLTDSLGTPVKDVSATPNSFSSNAVATYSVITSVTFTLHANVVGGPIKTQNSIFTWLPRIFFGVMTQGATVDEALIEALSGSYLSGTRANNGFTVNPGAGQVFVYAYPASFGDATFTVGGFEGGVSKVPDTGGGLGVRSVTNSHGVTLSYLVYASDTANLGLTTVKVS
jgi:hypothetical protein